MTLPSCCTHSSCFPDAGRDNVSMKGRTEDGGKEENRAWTDSVMLWDIILPVYLPYLLSGLFLPSSRGEYNKHTRSTREVQASLVAQVVKNPPAMQETWVWSLGLDDSLEKGKATHSSILDWRIPWAVSSMGLQRVGLSNFRTRLSNFHSLTHSQGVNKVRGYAPGGGSFFDAF